MSHAVLGMSTNLPATLIVQQEISKAHSASITASATFGHPAWWTSSPTPGSSETEVFLPGTSSAGVADAMMGVREHRDKKPV
jgi:hypothetical protein